MKKIIGWFSSPLEPYDTRCVVKDESGTYDIPAVGEYELRPLPPLPKLKWFEKILNL